jgi:hypothetical protein
MPRREAPLIRSKEELRGAEKAFERMRTEHRYLEFAAEWQTFVDRLEKAWAKAERECQPFRNKFEPWQGTFKALRKSDALLLYLSQSRHADQHSVQVLMGFPMAALTLTLPPLATVEIQIDEEKGQLKVTAGDQDIQFSLPPLPKRFCLFPITNQGREYLPPIEHLGEKIDGTNPLIVAEKGLAFYRDFLRQAEAIFFPTTD